MTTLENSHILDIVRSRIKDNPVLSASLCHISCRNVATELLSNNAFDPAWIDIWPTLGKDIFELFSARSVIGAVGCESPAEASPAANSFKRLVIEKLSSIIQIHDLGRFGEAMPSDTRTEKVFEDLAAQFLGCWAQQEGYSAIKAELFTLMFGSSSITLQSSFDSKTLLQETLQSRRLSRPIYRQVSLEGPAHNQTFTVCVEAVNGLEAHGSGQSKKYAEQEAAKVFLATHLSGVRYPKGMQLRPDFNVKAAAMLIPHVPCAPMVSQLTSQLDLPSWANNLLALAFVHRSYSMSGAVGPFGKDNRLLAFVGSNVINWAIPHVMIELLSPTQIKSKGGISQMRARVGSEAAMVIAARILFSRGFNLLTGPGQQHVETIPARQVETLQAVIGALFFSRESPINTFDKVFKGVDFLLDPIRKAIYELPSERDEVLPLKTRLQERLQAIGVRIDYQSEVKNDGNSQTNTTKMRLSSLHNPESIQISLRPVVSKTHFAAKKVEEEGKLASIVLTLVDQIIGSSVYTDSKELGDLKIAKWILSHLFKFIEAAIFRGDDKAIARISVLQVFGVGSLFRRNFHEFEVWYLLASRVMKVETLPEATLRAIYSRFNSTMQIGHSQLISQLPRIECFIRDLDPLQKVVDLQLTPEYNEVLGAATAFRLLSCEVVESELADLVAEARLLYRAQNLSLSETTVNSIRCLEVRGSLLILVDTIFRRCKALSDRHEITISAFDTKLVFKFKKPSNISGSIRDELDSTLLWEMLCTLLPIIEVAESVEYMIVTVPNVISSVSGRPALNAWWSYHLGQSLDIIKNATVASILHDLKNELLAYSTAAERAIAATSQRSKYGLASDASSHREEALNKTLVLKALLQSSSSASIAPTSVSGFFRSFTADLLSWLPECVSLSLPVDASTDIFSTDQDKLRSILTNIVRNSIKAMNGQGHVSISYIYDRVADALEIEVRDNGPGLNKVQLESLKLGIALPSTSRQGPGIGLLSVLLVTNELHGKVQFTNHKLGGLVVGISLPSMIQDNGADGNIYVTSKIGESVVIDEDTLGR